MIDIADASAKSFRDAAVVVTGVGRAGQVGEIVALQFGLAGATVHCLDRSEAVQDRAADLRARGIDAVGHQCDLTDFAATRALAQSIAARHAGAVAAVAAIAGGFGMSGPLAESDPAVFSTQIAINATSALSTARAFLPAVRAARGAFIFVSAAAALPGGKVAGISAYAMAKGAVLQLVRSIAQEEVKSGVRANAIAPTALRTAANLEAMGDGIRYVEREELAAVAVALCGPAFSRVTGQVFELA
jgi:NAD(P)-dependent dehydrogenase (short-subunit alcohol dehydrogenase family)